MLEFRRDVVALLDTNVLYPMALCDLLLSLAEDFNGFYTPRWSADIFEELRRNLVADGRCTPTQALRRLQLMNDAFPEAMVEDYERLIPAMQNHEGDRHVLAAAVAGRCALIVTKNVRHFPSAATTPFGVTAVTPDRFFQEIFPFGDTAMFLLPALYRQSQSLRRPQLTIRDVLNALAPELPETIKLLRSHFSEVGEVDFTTDRRASEER